MHRPIGGYMDADGNSIPTPPSSESVSDDDATANEQAETQAPAAQKAASSADAQPAGTIVQQKAPNVEQMPSNVMPAQVAAAQIALPIAASSAEAVQQRSPYAAFSPVPSPTATQEPQPTKKWSWTQRSIGGNSHTFARRCCLITCSLVRLIELLFQYRKRWTKLKTPDQNKGTSRGGRAAALQAYADIAEAVNDFALKEEGRTLGVTLEECKRQIKYQEKKFRLWHNAFTAKEQNVPQQPKPEWKWLMELKQMGKEMGQDEGIAAGIARVPRTQLEQDEADDESSDLHSLPGQRDDSDVETTRTNRKHFASNVKRVFIKCVSGAFVTALKASKKKRQAPVVAAMDKFISFLGQQAEKDREEAEKRESRLISRMQPITMWSKVPLRHAPEYPYYPRRQPPPDEYSEPSSPMTPPPFMQSFMPPAFMPPQQPFMQPSVQVSTPPQQQLPPAVLQQAFQQLMATGVMPAPQMSATPPPSPQRSTHQTQQSGASSANDRI
jgi:hypothetical protein